MIDDAIEQYDVLGIWSLFSGGHDSLTATHLASRHSEFKGVIHIDTGTGLQQTRKYVEDTCKKYSWPLIIKSGFMTYEMLIVRNGFMGAPLHKIPYIYLKDRVLAQVTKEIKKDYCGEKQSKIGLVSGVRKSESDRRAEIKDEPSTNGVRLWLPIIANWSATDCGQYIKTNGLERSQVKDKLHMSGECFCGAYKKRNEFNEIEFWYPRQAERIQNWERLVRHARRNQQQEVMNGQRTEVDIPEWATQWGTSRNYSNEQQPLFPMCQLCREVE
jgi:3'-phosphoadenosine 5'-phosphosulfate sulfotransferase (PAPS reductase)/FAD synthetase